ncbi:unnamed protein product [Citrullus colocynthis]|uniref:Uncharacterized protein n=1 Tax=Citrullus colocynthis TaxID=252529 RepID=A0ABP0YWR9_9ROSI
MKFSPHSPYPKDPISPPAKNEKKDDPISFTSALPTLLLIIIIVEIGLSSNTKAATMVMPLMAILIMILLLNPTISNAALNDTASKWCDSALENCLVGGFNSDSEFLMEIHTSRMLLDFDRFQTSKTNDPNKESVPSCGRPPRYDSCLGQKKSIPLPENCDPRNRANPWVIHKNPSNTVSGFRESCGHLKADVGFSKVRYQIFKIGWPRSLCIPACVSLNHPQIFSISTISSPHSFCFSFSISVPFSHHHHPLPDSISYVSLVRLSSSCDLFLFYEFDPVSED